MSRLVLNPRVLPLLPREQDTDSDRHGDSDARAAVNDRHEDKGEGQSEGQSEGESWTA